MQSNIKGASAYYYIIMKYECKIATIKYNIHVKEARKCIY